MHCYDEIMSDVQFETDNQFKNITGPTVGIVQAENKMAEWLLRRRIAKTETQANLILVGVVIVAVAIGIAALRYIGVF